MSRFGDAPRTFDAVGKFDEPMLYVCPPRVKKGVIVRGDVELDSPLIATLPVGTQMTVYRSKHTSDGKVRLKIKTPVVGWISEKSVERDVLSAADENVEFGEDGEPLAKPEKFSLKRTSSTRATSAARRARRAPSSSWSRSSWRRGTRSPS